MSSSAVKNDPCPVHSSGTDTSALEAGVGSDGSGRPGRRPISPRSQAENSFQADTLISVSVQ